MRSNTTVGTGRALSRGLVADLGFGTAKNLAFVMAPLHPAITSLGYFSHSYLEPYQNTNLMRGFFNNTTGQFYDPVMTSKLFESVLKDGEGKDIKFWDMSTYKKMTTIVKMGGISYLAGMVGTNEDGTAKDLSSLIGRKGERLKAVVSLPGNVWGALDKQMVSFSAILKVGQPLASSILPNIEKYGIG